MRHALNCYNINYIHHFIRKFERNTSLGYKPVTENDENEDVADKEVDENDKEDTKKD